MTERDPYLAVFAEQLGMSITLYAELVELFADVGSSDLEKLGAAVAGRDSGQAAEAAHSLKGAAAQIGLTLLAENARDIELRARDGLWTGVPQQVDRLQCRFRLVAGLVGS